MPLHGLLGVLRESAAVSAFAAGAATTGGGAARVSAPAGLWPFLLGALSESLPDGGSPQEGKTAQPPPVVLAVTPTGREAEDLAEAMGAVLDPERVAVFPAWETLPHERLSPGTDTVGRRLAVRRRLAHPTEDFAGSGRLAVVVAPVRALLQPFVPGLGEVAPLGLRAGDEHDFDAAVRQLAELGYERTDLVERRGQFAVRGGLLDVFPPQEDHPLRVEFWGDTVEETRWFRVSDQRSLETSPGGVWAPACRELPFTEPVRAAALALSEKHPALTDLLEAVSEGRHSPGVEALAPALVGSMALLTDELPRASHVVVVDHERVRTRASDLIRTGEEFLRASWLASAAGGDVPVDLAESGYRELETVESAARARGLPWWPVTGFGVDTEVVSDGAVLAVPARPAAGYAGEIDRLVADVADWSRDGRRVVLVQEGHGPAQRTHEMLSEAEIGSRLVSDLVAAPEPGSVTVTTGPLETGFVLDEVSLVVLTGSDMVGRGVRRTRESHRMPTRRRKAIDPLALKPGDFVVHEQHGVGRYVEMISRTVAGATREYLVLEYAPARKGKPPDRLFVPIESLDQVTRYVGGEQPALHRMGGADWKKAKGRARKAVRDIAAGLVRLYAARTATPGHAFSPDTPWQVELEDAFPYTETPDQAAAIDEVKADMERPVPMDRVICGDVGFGKTEIAVRAAFKAVQDGRQVAVLAPTTLLAQQHVQTFSERLAQFPVTVRELSRFTPATQAKATLSGLSDGSVDIVVGTHRLMQPGVTFRNLGLVVVDEEQRFGVEHKEQLKKLRTNVDVLTLSATPIPRTLEMSLTGIREMSTIQTPPEERHPVLTFVGPYDERQIGAAIRRELLREGQVFYVHNRVETIERAARRLRELVPEAHFEVGHGQMSEEALEQVMLGFWERDYDVLVCTTIVESGLDISNANTLIVERADTLGLAQLHQLRGRVGRGRERGYAYFLYPPERPLTESAHQRLATIASNTELGSGMAVAMKDLEIRGAGNMLGGEQSGRIADVGFDLYVRMVAEAVAELRDGGTAPEEPVELRVDLPVDAHIPHSWVDVERLRLEAYQRIAQAHEPAELAEVRAELVDRYGELPQPVANLIDVALLRQQLPGLGLTEVVAAAGKVRFAPLELRDSQQMRLKRLYPKAQYRPPVSGPQGRPGSLLLPAPGGSPARPARDADVLAWVRRVLGDVLDVTLRGPEKVQTSGERAAGSGEPGPPEGGQA